MEGAHKSEELAEKGAKYGTRKIREGYRSHKLKPYRAAAKAEKAAEKANVNYLYHKTLHENPQLTSNPLSRFMQKQQIKRQYAKSARKGGAKTAQKPQRTPARRQKRPPRKQRKRLLLWGGTRRALVSPLPRCSYSSWYQRDFLPAGLCFPACERRSWDVLHVGGQRPCGDGK